MGIHNFHKWIKQTYPGAREQIKSKIYIDHVYIDLNFCLHLCAYNAKSFKMLFIKLESFIDNLLSNVVPTKSVVFASDGVAPYAKLLLQRKRRLQMLRSEKYDVAETNKAVNPLYFTPGTIFMNQLDKNLEKKFNQIRLNKKIEVHRYLNDVGEAEMKLFKHMNTILAKCDDKHAIISNDADVVAIAMANNNYQNINIVTKINNYEIISLKKLIELMNPISHNNKHIDYSLLFLMMGNDYLPKLNYIKIEKSIVVYNKIIESKPEFYLVKEKLFNIENLKYLLTKLINTIPKNWRNNFKLKTYNPNFYKNYLEGLLWCITDYNNCWCSNFEYMYKFRVGPHPLGLYYYLLFENPILEYPIKSNKDNEINNNIYGILTLPKKLHYILEKEIVDKTNLFQKDLKFLFEEEMCQECISIHKEISGHHKSLRCMVDMDYEEISPDNKDKMDILRDKIGNLNVIMREHKSIHKDLTINDINYIINIFN